MGACNAVLNNLTVKGGALLTNDSSDAGTLTVHYDAGKSGSFANGTLSAPSGNLNIVKTGAGTLALANNNSGYKGTFTISEGTVTARVNDQNSSSFGTNTGSRIQIEENGTLQLTVPTITTGKQGMKNSVLLQKVAGTGTLRVSAGASVVLLNQSEQFGGTVHLTGNTRLFIGTNFNLTGGSQRWSNLNALNTATIRVDSGSQARVTNQYVGPNGSRMNSYANYIISGPGFWGASSSVAAEGMADGALSVDLGSTIYGTVTLAADAAVASWSNIYSSYAVNNYGQRGTLGGAILGNIYGEGKTLTRKGNETLTLKADAASTYGNLVISGSNGENGALLLAQGNARDTVSTALGTGTVTLNGGLLLRFSGAGTSDTAVTYTYNNDFRLGNNSTLQSYGNTTTLGGRLTLTGETLNLGTANGSVLRLEKGLEGTGKTVRVADSSLLVLGGEQGDFSGTVNMGAGSDLTLLSSGALDQAAMNFTDSLVLRLTGDGEYSLNSLTGASSQEDGAGNLSLSLYYDFTSGHSGGMLSVNNLTATDGNIYLGLNTTQDLQKGTYTLIDGDVTGIDFTLGSGDLNGRLTLLNHGADGLKLVVDADDRLFWRHGESDEWNASALHWHTDTGNGLVASSPEDVVVFDESGITAGNSETAPETVRLSEQISAGTVIVKGDSCYAFTGEGSITGEHASLVVAGGASLLLETSGNVFAEGVTLNHGKLTVAAAQALTDSSVSLEEGARLSVAHASALAGNTAVTFNGGILTYDAAGIGDLSAFLRVGTGDVALDFNGHTNLALANSTHLSNARLDLRNTAYPGGDGGKSAVTLGSASRAFAINEGSLNLEEGVSVTHYAGNGNKIAVLEGAGDYAVNVKSSGSSVSTVTITDMRDFNGKILKTGNGNLSITNKSAAATWTFLGESWGDAMNFNAYAVDNATITLIGASGWGSKNNGSFLALGSPTFKQNFVLNQGDYGYGLKITNGASNTTITFAGAISGDGKFLLDRKSMGATVTDKFAFTGDLSQFEGGFDIRGTAPKAAVILSDNQGATQYAKNESAAGTGTISLDITTPGNAASLILNYQENHGLSNAISGTGNIAKEGAGEIALTGDLSGMRGEFLVKQGAVTLSGDHSSIRASFSGEGALRISEGTSSFNGGTLAVNTTQISNGGMLRMDGSVTAQSGGAGPAVMTGVSLSGEGLASLSESSPGEISNAAILFTGGEARTAASHAMEDLHLINTSVTLDSGDLAMNNILLDSGSSVINESGGALTLSNCALDSGDLQLTIDASNPHMGNLVFSNFQGVTLNDSFTLSLSNATISSILSQNSLLHLNFILENTSYENNLALSFVGDSVSLLPEITEIDSRESDGHTVIHMTLNTGENIPEPSGALLLMLGAGVMLTRRRTASL